ncbi:peptidase M50 family protein, partial [Vibrio parahaemolyticus V-223/04]
GDAGSGHGMASKTSQPLVATHSLRSIVLIDLVFSIRWWFCWDYLVFRGAG